MEQIEKVADARKKELLFYSPYNFIRKFDEKKQLQYCVYDPILNFEHSPENQVVNIPVQGHDFLFYVSYLPWDTNYFGIKTYRLSYVLYSNDDFSLLCEAAKRFSKQFLKPGTYCFIEIPSEDIRLIQALNLAGFRLVETRLTYYRGELDKFSHERYPVRIADKSDTGNLMRVAREMRNDYDRFHADTVFSHALADDFLSVYIQQSLQGFADVVLTPDEPGLPPDSFLTARYLNNTWEKYGVNISKMVLSAVSSETNKGWYKKLIVEMTYHLRSSGASYIFMNTQSTNRAVLHTWESLGYKLGCTTHILSYNS